MPRMLSAPARHPGHRHLHLYVHVRSGSPFACSHAKGDLFEHGYQLSRITGAAKAPHRQQQQRQTGHRIPRKSSGKSKLLGTFSDSFPTLGYLVLWHFLVIYLLNNYVSVDIIRLLFI